MTDNLAAAQNSSAGLEIGRLVREQHEALFRYAYRLTGSTADAEDLCQQAFLIAHQKLDQLRSVQCVKSWLFTVLRHAFLRSVRRPLPLALADCALEAEAIPDDLPHDWEIDHELVQAAINELADEQKLVVLLFYFEECSYREIAQRLELPLGTVMSRLSRAKSHLRARLLESQFALATASRLAGVPAAGYLAGVPAARHLAEATEVSEPAESPARRSNP